MMRKRPACGPGDVRGSTHLVQRIESPIRAATPQTGAEHLRGDAILRTVERPGGVGERRMVEDVKHLRPELKLK
jgi:hypothetical protein